MNHVRVQDCGSIILLEPISRAADAWCRYNLPEDAQTFGNSIAIERRYWDPIAEALELEGLLP